MVKMRLFPYHNCKFNSDLTIEAIIGNLKGIVDEHGNGGIISSKFYGEINGNTFSVYRSSYFFHTTLVKVNGKLSKTKSSSLIELKFYPAEFAFTFMLIFELLLLTIVVLTALYSDALWKAMLPIPLMIIGYLMLSVPFYLIGNNAKKVLLDKLEGKEV
jgi:hypothetical protein